MSSLVGALVSSCFRVTTVFFFVLFRLVHCAVVFCVFFLFSFVSAIRAILFFFFIHFCSWCDCNSICLFFFFHSYYGFLFNFNLWLLFGYLLSFYLLCDFFVFTHLLVCPQFQQGGHWKKILKNQLYQAFCISCAIDIVFFSLLSFFPPQLFHSFIVLYIDFYFLFLLQYLVPFFSCSVLFWLWIRLNSQNDYG